MLWLNNLQVSTIIHIEELSFMPGYMYGIIGPNGAGKSTLLKAISQDIPALGTLQFHGRDISSWPRHELARHLAVLPQSSQLNFNFTGRDVIRLGAIPLQLSRTNIEREIDRLIQQFRLAEFVDQPFPSLSGGEKQRVQLARVNLQLCQAEQPALILLDEPISAQDLQHQHNILQYLKQLCDQRYIVLAVIHDINHALNYCDHICIMQQGKCALTGKAQEVINANNIFRYWQQHVDELSCEKTNKKLYY